MQGETYKDGKLEEIRTKDGFWLNTSVFREAGDRFMKRGGYNFDSWGTPDWISWWKEERNRCIHGFEVGGVKITGDHYNYLNYSPIKKIGKIKGNRAVKVEGFPDFWDGDYNYFWVREIARNGIFGSLVKEDEESIEISFKGKEQLEKAKELYDSLNLAVIIAPEYLNGGYNLIVGKSRRKGYSFKAASIASNNYFTRPKSLTILAAYDKKYLYPKGTFGMTFDNINFINEHTAWAMPSDVLNKLSAGHIRASYIQYKDGNRIEKGFKSEILSLTYKDNPDAGRGKDAYDVDFEEAGAFGTPGLLKNSYVATQDCVMAGAIKTGLITVFGTSGDMEGGTADYADMMSRPKAFGFLPFQNIWDDKSEDMLTGFFHPINWNMEGFYDENGNSDKEGAKKLELEERKKLLDAGATSVEIQKRMQEKPLGPQEAFGSVSTNNFPVRELQRRLSIVKAKNYQYTKGTPVDLSYEKGRVKVEPILSGKDRAITSLYNLPNDRRGTPIIYELPLPDAPSGLYKIGYDPVRQESGTSLAAIVVYRTKFIGAISYNIIVAEYLGRMETPTDHDKIAEMFADLYGTKIMYENEVTGVKTYFQRIKRLNLLALQPDAVISKNIKNSKVARVFGCHMNLQLKIAAEGYTQDWLRTVVDYDEHGDPITVVDQINSVRLLEELIAYNRTGNFDLVSALFMCLIQEQEEVLGTVHKPTTENSTAQQLLEQLASLTS